MAVVESLEADIAVIGGGIAGVSVAAGLAGHASVVLLEQERELAYHTTGRSAAMFLESYGGPDVRALTSARRPRYDAVGGLLTPRPLLWVAAPGRRAALETLAAGNPTLCAVDEREARARCPVLRPEWLAGALLEPGAMEIDV